MLQNAMGPGSKKIHTHATPNGPVAVVDYEDGRLGVVEMSETSYAFGGNLRLEKESTGFTCDAGDTYSFELKSIVNFFQGEPAPVQVEDTLEVTAMLQAAEKSLQSGQPCAVEQARS
jgi:predicted dehydrogenase